MNDCRVAAIERWFADWPDEFVNYGDQFPTAWQGDVVAAELLVYTTKLHCIERIKSAVFPGRSVAVLGRYGLPHARDLAWLENYSKPLVFLGDADPPDLLVFAWLQARLAIQYIGVNDRFLNSYFRGSLDQICIPLSPGELGSIDFLIRILPGYQELLGSNCTGLLQSGYKVELEGAALSID